MLFYLRDREIERLRFCLCVCLTGVVQEQDNFDDEYEEDDFVVDDDVCLLLAWGRIVTCHVFRRLKTSVALQREARPRRRQKRKKRRQTAMMI